MADMAHPLMPARPRLGLWSLLALLAVAVFAISLATRPLVPDGTADAPSLTRILLWQSLLPRAAIALLAGAALGLSGALLQRVLRNPIADPSTLGIASGAQLAMTLAILYAPLVGEIPREGAALAGGVAAVFLVLLLGWKRGLEPVTVVLSGMVVSLVASALSAALVLSHGEYVLSLFIWGAGSLHQQSWDSVLAIAPRLALGALAAGLLLRPLAVLGLDDASARSLGTAVHSARLLVIAVAVGLAASVTAEVGVIGFVGLAAPAFARLSGVRTQGRMLLAAPLIGGLLLWLTDGLVQLASHGLSDVIPTGAATGLLGGPLLLWLLPRLSVRQRPAPAPTPVLRLHRPLRALALLTAGAILIAGVALVLGRSYDGWSLATGEMFTDLLPFRAPRIAAAAAAGALLGTAGTVMQRLTGNPLAGPEVLGVSAGAGVGLAAVLLLAATPSLTLMLAGSAAGSLAAILAILAFAAWTGFGPERLLLAGIALGAMGLAFMTAVLALGDRRAFTLLVWMSGSTDRVGPSEATVAAVAAAVLIAPLPLLGRWLDILPLGGAVSSALGVSVRASRLVLALCAALMTAAAAFIVGPLSLVGLIGPHLARLLGLVRGAPQLIAAAILSAGLMMLADWLGRVLAFPYQIPVGLFAALVGGPYLIWLLRRGPVKGD
ncbi:Fe(3+)-hydroxamate ABC transporter permease FhuB [Azorhizobium sp. AG788]|uniref:Fe(3+)-hydroxamate ABC transporter permease FhuB n=1 Tax=Azorhizobium sp. AG788 TaxID=2183897 RepID=UPI003138E402